MASAGKTGVSDSGSEPPYDREKLTELSETMFKDIVAYLQGELSITAEDYNLLERMNNMTTDKYKGLTESTKDMVASMEELQEKYESFRPHLEQIDQLELSVEELENTVTLLDGYTKRLDIKFRSLRK